MTDYSISRIEARKLKDALLGFEQARETGDADLAERAAEIFEELGAERLAAKAREFAARLLEEAKWVTDGLN